MLTLKKETPTEFLKRLRKEIIKIREKCIQMENKQRDNQWIKRTITSVNPDDINWKKSTDNHFQE